MICVWSMKVALDIAVKSGTFWDGSTARAFAGASGVTLADDKEAVYVYLDDGGNLVTTEYGGFPAATVSHMRLAVVSTADGEVSAIIDRRGDHMWFCPGAFVTKDEAETLTNKTLSNAVLNGPSTTAVIEAHTADDTLTQTETGSIHTNAGAGSTVTLTLPADPDVGTLFTFAVQSAIHLRIDPGTAAIRDDCGSTADKFKSANAIGACLTIAADADGNWVTIAKNGSWIEEA